jgi:SAM-dependent methyltransferase
MSFEPRSNGVRRLHWGCGDWVEPGWINADVKDLPGVDLCCDIRDGLPLPSGSIDYAVSVHALPELTLEEQIPALRELHRVLRPSGVLRLALPDLDLAVDAYRRGDRDYFLIPDEHAEFLGSKLVVQLLWYGFSNGLYLRLRVGTPGRGWLQPHRQVHLSRDCERLSGNCFVGQQAGGESLH